jgi:hypothetical protein
MLDCTMYRAAAAAAACAAAYSQASTAGLHHAPVLLLPVLRVLTLGSMLPHTAGGTAVHMLGLLALTQS